MIALCKVSRPDEPGPAMAGEVAIRPIPEVPGGGWHHVMLDGKPVAVAYCPKCGKKGYLNGHEIADDGKVTPSLICPHTPCDFHDFVRLLGYEA